MAATLVLSVLSMASGGAARGQARVESLGGGAPGAGAGTPPGPTTNVPATGDGQAAPPGAGEAAKQSAKAAELHPIQPSPEAPRPQAFQLYAEIDLPVLGVGLVFAAARVFRLQPAYCAPLCDRSGLNALDRTTAGYWSPGWQTASTAGLYGLGVGAAALLLVDEGAWPALNDLVVVAESALAATALASTGTLAAGRPRPFLYGEKAPLSARNGADAGLSYLSSHAAISFAIASSSFMAMRRLHPRSKAPLIVMGVGGAVATFVAAARVMGGMHFITDVAGGAIEGTSLGVLIPALHGSPAEVVPMVGESQRGLALAGRF